MKRFCRRLGGLLLLCVFCLACSIRGMAAAGRTYTVTLYAGNHGKFMDTSFVSVAGGGADAGIYIEEDGSFVRVSGLKKGDMLALDAAAEGAVEMEDNSKYYIKGIRRSGRDNSTVDNSACSTDADRDYVVAYAIRGNMVPYVVNYENKEGRALVPSRTYHGNVGDRPVAAFVYIPGYVPQAYNLTKTLSENAEENVFTFVYSRLPSSGQGSQGGSGRTEEEGQYSITEAVREEGTQEGQKGQKAERAAVVSEEVSAESGTDENLPVWEEQGTGEPDAPRQVVGLDDEEIPLAEGRDKPDDFSFFPVLAAISLAIPALSIAFLILWLRKCGAEKEQDE